MLDCECCYKKFTTSGCLTCTTYNIKRTIQQLNYEIVHIKYIQNYKYFINKMYAKDILEHVDFSRVDFLVSSKMEADQIVIRVDKRAINELIKIEK